ncbi:MAG: hypothetical protein V1649_04545 [Patescibacteria group bacterium]
MQKFLSKIWIIGVLVVVFAGGFFSWQHWKLQKGEIGVSQIATGKIEIDYEKFEKTKGELPEGGHQPWLADPKLVASAEGPFYGFINKDFERVKESVVNTGSGIAKYEVPHRDKIYVITVIQPVVGQNKVWTIFEIQEKKTEDETANWQTYRNEEYGFEIKYPLEGMLYKEISEINFYKNPTYKGIKIGELRFGCSPYIYPNIDDKFLSLLKEFKEESGESMYPLSEVIKHDGKKYYFGFSIASHAVDIESCQLIFNQMLSTFRFLE